MPWHWKKTAERLVIELKDKVSSSQSVSTPSSETLQTNLNSTSKHQDAVSSLMILGYKIAEADKRVSQAIQKLGIETSVEAIIKEALS